MRLMRGNGVGVAVTVLTLAVATSGGCSSMKPGQMSVVQPDSTSERAGNVYLLRGWIGIFSTGIDNLTDKINQTGVRAHVFQDDQYRRLAKEIRDKYRNEADHEPLVLVGHSYGADDVIRIARELNKDNIRVDLLVTLDPVTPPKVPANVVTAVNLYQSNGIWDTMPWLRGVPVTADEPGPQRLAQWDIRTERTELLDENTDHFNIEKKPRIHDEVVKHVLEACPPRPQWLAMTNGGASPTAAAPTAEALTPVPGGGNRVAPAPPQVGQPVMNRTLSGGTFTVTHSTAGDDPQRPRN